MADATDTAGYRAVSEAVRIAESKSGLIREVMASRAKPERSETAGSVGGVILCLRALADNAGPTEAHAMREAANLIRDQAAEIGRLRAANTALRENARMWARAAGAIFEDVING